MGKETLPTLDKCSTDQRCLKPVASIETIGPAPWTACVRDACLCLPGAAIRDDPDKMNSNKTLPWTPVMDQAVHPA